MCVCLFWEANIDVFFFAFPVCFISWADVHCGVGWRSGSHPAAAHLPSDPLQVLQDRAHAFLPEPLWQWGYRRRWDLHTITCNAYIDETVDFESTSCYYKTKHFSSPKRNEIPVVTSVGVALRGDLFLFRKHLGYLSSHKAAGGSIFMQMCIGSDDSLAPTEKPCIIFFQFSGLGNLHHLLPLERLNKNC